MTTPVLPTEISAPPAPDPLPDPAADFVGRGFLRSLVREFLGLQNRMLLLVSTPGTGKTAFLQALEREHHGDKRPYFFYSCAQGDGANPFVFCTQLSEQLQSILGPDFKLNATARQQQVSIKATVETGSVATGANVAALQLHIGGMHPREAFRQLVREPLRAYNDTIGVQRDQQPLVILIDALDQAWDWDNGQGGSLISALADAQDLPAWVSIICASRPGPSVQALQERSGVRIERIDPGAAENLADIRTFLNTRFLDRLDADDRSALEKALQTNNPFGTQTLDMFVDRVVKASQGNFLFVRHYVETLSSALDPASSANLPELVRVEGSLASLAAAMDSAYERVLDSLDERIGAAPNDADKDVLATLAIAYAPASVAVISRISGRNGEEVRASLERLAPVLAEGASDETGYSFFHSGFADFYRRTRLVEQTRDWNARAAQLLDEGDADERVRAYAALYRWSHLRRSLRLAWPNNPTRSDAPTTTENTAPTAAMLLSTASVQEQVPQPITQAQALRGLAAQALAPELANVPGSWNQALDYLRAAERTLGQSRALRRQSRRRYTSVVPPEQVEMERTLTALGDAYVTIGQRMDPHIPSRTQPHGVFQAIHAIWDAFARLPLTIFLLLVLFVQGAREMHLMQTLQNLGRGQDWTVARLYMLAIASYRRALNLAQEREDDEAVDDVTERLARLYALMGAYDSATATYSALMARPAALARQWHQAVWRLELGEVQLANGRFNQAVDMFSSARLTFETQNTTVQLARTLSGLARGYYWQAGLADSRNDTENATALYYQSLAASAGALEQWKLVAVLPNVLLGITDPDIGTSAVGHLLWEMSTNKQLDVDQQQRARTLLDSIAERHFPQRFEHPLLRLFRLGMAVALPAYLLIGLLLAVQLPNQIRVQTSTGIELPSPQLDLAQFPDNVMTGRSPIPSVLTEDNLTHLLNSGVKVTPSSDWLSYENISGNTQLSELSNDALFAGFLYYLSYLVIGVAILLIASPAHFQIYRPGRLVLTNQTLSWRGVPGQHAVLNVWVWLKRECTTLFRRGADMAQRVQPILRPFAKRLLDIIELQLRLDEDQAVRQHIDLPLNQIGSLIFADLHVLRFVLYDFSSTIVRPRDPKLPEIIIDGRLVYYRELCDELAHRVQKLAPSSGPVGFLSRPFRRQPDQIKIYTIDLVNSRWGVLFSLMLCFSAVMVVLLQLNAEVARKPITPLDYSLNNLYILIAPGLLLPLIWWCVFRPLGIWQERAALRWPLAGAAMLGSVVTAAVVISQISLVRFGLKPDLALPLFAAGLMLAVAYYARPQPLRPQLPLSRQWILGVLLAFSAVVCVFLLLDRVRKTVSWYDAVVRGNYNLEQYYQRTDCNPVHGCDLLQRADQSYTRALSFDDKDWETHALRGQAALAYGDTAKAISDFADAMPAPEQANAIQLTNIATAHMLAARESGDPETSLSHYQLALAGYHGALKRYDRSFTDVLPTCPALADRLVPGNSTTPFVLRQPEFVYDSDKLLTIRQLADACLNLGLMRSKQIDGKLDAARNPAASTVWYDLAGAAIGFQTVAESSDKGYEQLDTKLGAAAAWLQLSLFSAPPQNMPDRRTAALMALQLYKQIQIDFGDNLIDVSVRREVAAGAAWSALQLGAWDSAIGDSATFGLRLANQQDASDPTFPALEGLIRWFDSTQYATPSRVRPSPAYVNAITQTLTLYDQAIDRGFKNADQAYAIRSLLNFSLRNSQSGPRYNDADYGMWMQLAMHDVDQAIDQAQTLQRDPGQLAGLRYWRGRLAMSLATTWQQKLRGPHEWNEILPLYSRAYDDFTAAAADDTNATRREAYKNFWIPWSKVLLNNSSHYALAQAALRDGRVEQAISELGLIDPKAVQPYDKGSAAIPDYSYLYGLVRVAAGRDLPFPNPLLAKDKRQYDMLASFGQAIADTESGKYIQRATVDNPFDSRSVVYRAVIGELNRLLANPNITPTTEDRRRAERIRTLIIDQLTGGNPSRR